jgi:uncharacterized protein HemY
MFKIVFWFLLFAAAVAGSLCALLIFGYVMIGVRPQFDQFTDAHPWVVGSALISLFVWGFGEEAYRRWKIRDLIARSRAQSHAPSAAVNPPQPQLMP